MGDVGNLDLGAVALDPLGVLLELEVLYHVFVVELGRGCDLLLQELESSLVEVGVVEAEDLQGVLRAVLGRAELHLGAEAGAEGLSECESVNG